MMTTKRRISRCSVVMDVGAAEDSLAMRPLWVACETKTDFGEGEGNEDAQDSVVTDLEYKTDTRSADTERSLQCDVLGLSEEGQSSLSEDRYSPKSHAHLEDVLVRLFQASRNWFTLRQQRQRTAP